MANEDDDDESRALRTPIISAGEAVVLAVLFVLGLMLASRDLEKSWLGAVLSGICDADPAPPECTPPFWGR